MKFSKWIALPLLVVSVISCRDKPNLADPLSNKDHGESSVKPKKMSVELKEAFKAYSLARRSEDSDDSSDYEKSVDEIAKDVSTMRNDEVEAVLTSPVVKDQQEKYETNNKDNTLSHSLIAGGSVVMAISAVSAGFIHYNRDKGFVEVRTRENGLFDVSNYPNPGGRTTDQKIHGVVSEYSHANTIRRDDLENFESELFFSKKSYEADMTALRYIVEAGGSVESIFEGDDYSDLLDAKGKTAANISTRVHPTAAGYNHEKSIKIRSEAYDAVGKVVENLRTKAMLPHADAKTILAWKKVQNALLLHAQLSKEAKTYLYSRYAEDGSAHVMAVQRNAAQLDYDIAKASRHRLKGFGVLFGSGVLATLVGTWVKSAALTGETKQTALQQLLEKLAVIRKNQIN